MAVPSFGNWKPKTKFFHGIHSGLGLMVCLDLRGQKGRNKKLQWNGKDCSFSCEKSPRILANTFSPCRMPTDTVYQSLWSQR